MKRILLALTLFIIGISAAACVLISHRVQVQPIDPRNGVNVMTSVKAHLKDGSTITYPNGVTISGGILRGMGVLNDITLTQSRPVQEVPLENVVGMESFETRVNVTKTVLTSSLASVGVAVGAAALALVIFGSCPTVYSEGNVEEAELFSTSIAPLFETRDIDRLKTKGDSNGVVALDFRNEAMETHYINHLQLLEVEHSSDEFVLPSFLGEVVAVRGMRPPATITNRAGFDVRATVEAVDDNAYATALDSIRAATAQDMNDWLDLEIPVAPDADTTHLVFRMRNSLLSTTLLYDVMLGPAGARALDWFNQDLTKISTAVELGRWYQKRAGLHISVWRDGQFREVARIPDSGPISWHDVAAAIPVPAGEAVLKVRLNFLADHWRIDRVSIASNARSIRPRVISIASVQSPGGRDEDTARASLDSPDDRYLQTSPGQQFQVRFNVGKPTPALSRTFLLSSQGYYTEWIRGKWIQSATADAPFTPTDESLLIALRKWSETRVAFEKQFRETRVPVR